MRISDACGTPDATESGVLKPNVDSTPRPVRRRDRVTSAAPSPSLSLCKHSSKKGERSKLSRPVIPRVHVRPRVRRFLNGARPLAQDDHGFRAAGALGRAAAPPGRRRKAVAEVIQVGQQVHSLHVVEDLGEHARAHHHEVHLVEQLRIRGVDNGPVAETANRFRPFRWCKRRSMVSRPLRVTRTYYRMATMLMQLAVGASTNSSHETGSSATSVNVP